MALIYLTSNTAVTTECVDRSVPMSYITEMVSWNDGNERQAGDSLDRLGIVSEEVRLARLDKTLADIRNLRERFHNGLTAKRLFPLKDYLEGRMKITLEVELIRAPDDSIDDGDEIGPVFVRLEICHP